MKRANAIIARLTELAAIISYYGIDASAIVDAIEWIRDHDGAEA